jgi:hypothetical protein
MTNAAFKTALREARLELKRIEADMQHLAQRKAQLLQTIAGLAPLCGEAPTEAGVTLADAIRSVISTGNAQYPTMVFTPKGVRDTLRAIGFDLSQFNNHMASIHTALKRMEQSGELEAAGDVEFGGGYRWKGKSNPYEMEPPPKMNLE